MAISHSGTNWQPLVVLIGSTYVRLTTRRSSKLDSALRTLVAPKLAVMYCTYIHTYNPSLLELFAIKLLFKYHTNLAGH